LEPGTPTSRYISTNTFCNYYSYYYGFTDLCWALTVFSDSLSCTQKVGLFGRGISPSQDLYLRTDHEHMKQAHNANIRALSGIRTYDPSVRESEDSYVLDPAATLIGIRSVIPPLNVN
jgi:hypothetical protein